jgi:hypothetical protein
LLTRKSLQKKETHFSTNEKNNKMMSTNNRAGRIYMRGGRGRGRSSFGRGRGRFQNRTSSNISKSAEGELKFSPHEYQGRTQAATYATIKDAIVQHIQKSYKGGQDVSKSLEDMTEVDLATAEPTRTIFLETDATVKVVDQEAWI